MDFKAKKRKLKKYPELLITNQHLKISIMEFEERAASLAMATTPGNLDKVRVSGGKNDLNKVSAFAEKDITKEELIRQQKQIDNEIVQILVSINNIENLEFRNAVYGYYIIGYKDYEMAKFEHIAESTVRWRRNKGIESLRFVPIAEIEKIK